MFILVIGHPSSGAFESYGAFESIGAFEFDQAEALHEAGHKVVYLSLDLRLFKQVRKFGKSDFVKRGIDVYDLAIPTIRGLPFFVLFNIRKIGLLSIYHDIVKTHGTPDIVHAHFTMWAAISTILKIKFNLPLVITEHSSLINHDIISKSTYKIAKKAYSDCNAIISVSSILQKRIRYHLELDSVVIPNIVNVNHFRYDPVKHDKFTFISVGRLLHNKGFDLLIHAFEVFKNHNVFLEIIGDGIERENLSILIKKLKLENQIFLLGYKPRHEIAAQMNKSDVFVLASRGETFGLAYAEAMITGLPVIATKCGGPEDFVNEDNGLLVPANDINALSNALLYMYENIKSYDSSRISESGVERFSPKQIASQLVSLYKTLI